MQLEGSLLGRYRLEKVIGHGGMGEVYQAHDSELKRQVAIKVIHGATMEWSNPQLVNQTERQFEREARAVAALDHPHILPLYDFGHTEIKGHKLTYLVMPLRQGGTLNQWVAQQLQKRGRSHLTSKEVADIVYQAASALQYAHNQHIVHQDVKPSNFLLRNVAESEKQIDIQLADFGIAHFMAATNSSIQMNPQGGTPAYMAPEQWRQHPEPASDQYALAVMAYELLVGHPPFRGNLGQLMFAHAQEEPAPPSARNTALTPAIDQVILRGLKKDPQERFPRIRDFSEALQQATLIGTPTISLSSHDAHSTRQTWPVPLNLHPQEAQSGTYKPVTLADGRQTVVAVPPGAHNGQILELPEQSARVQVTITERDIPIVERPTQNHKSTAPDGPPTESKFRKQTRPKKLVKIWALLALLVLLIGSAGWSVYTFFPGWLPHISPNQVDTGDIPPPGAKLVIDDPLRDNSKGNQWFEGDDTLGSCQFANQSYHVNMTLGVEACSSKKLILQNFAAQVRIKLLKGDGAGLVFRGSSDMKEFYFFYAKSDGTYLLSLYEGGDFTLPTTLKGGKIEQQGYSQEYTLSIIVRGPNIDLYINQHKVASLQDSTYKQGYIGVGVHSDFDTTEATFSDIRVWQI